jgi:hypothetical protein
MKIAAKNHVLSKGAMKFKHTLLIKSDRQLKAKFSGVGHCGTPT